MSTQNYILNQSRQITYLSNDDPTMTDDEEDDDWRVAAPRGDRESTIDDERSRVTSFLLSGGELFDRCRSAGVGAASSVSHSLAPLEYDRGDFFENLSGSGSLRFGLSAEPLDCCA